MIVLIGTLCLFTLIMGFYYAIKHDMKVKWFNKLNPGDKVLVTIHSDYCSCSRQANVVSLVDNGVVEAKMDDNTLDKCKTCSQMKAINNKGENTCWYHVNKFLKDDVDKI